MKGFVSDIENGVKAAEALNNALKKIGEKLVDKSIDIAINALVTPRGGGGLGGLIAGLFSGSAGPALQGPTLSGAPLAHAGGIIGVDSFPTRAVSMAAFLGAPRLHGGMSASEFPAILQFGEMVLTRRQSQRAMNAMNGLASALADRPAVAIANTVNVVNNVVNNTDSKFTTKSRNSSQGPNLDVIIDSMVAEKLATPGSASNRAARTFLGSRQQLTSR